jgi:hypothetical protein
VHVLGFAQHFLDARRTNLDDALEQFGVHGGGWFHRHADQQRLLGSAHPRRCVGKLLLNHGQAGVGVGAEHVVAYRREVDAAQPFAKFPGVVFDWQAWCVADVGQQGL